MTNAIYFSDLHIDDYKPFSSNRDRLEDCLLVIDDVYKLAVKKDVEIILFGGDLFNTPKFLYTKVLDRTIAKFADKIAEYPNICWFAITGQHDFATKNLLDKPTLSALQHLARIFPNNFRVLDNKLVEVAKDVWICGIPNYEFKEHFLKSLHGMSITAFAYKNRGPIKVTLMIHESPEGQYNPNVRTQTSPNDPLYDPFDMVLCGDIHTSQRITDKFLIAGNPLHKDVGDQDKEKGIYFLDLENPTAIRFVSRKGRYPEFKKVKRGQLADADKHLLIVEEETGVEDKEANNKLLAEFGSSVPREELFTNLWKKLDGKDKKLLETGLSFLPK